MEPIHRCGNAISNKDLPCIRTLNEVAKKAVYEMSIVSIGIYGRADGGTVVFVSSPAAST